MKHCIKCGSMEYTAEGSENGDILSCMNCGHDEFIEMPVKATFKQFIIKANYKGTKRAEWSDNRHQNFNNHMVTVTNTETAQKITFEFWASIAHPVLKTEHDILNAFYCFIGDAIVGNYSFDEFCSEFGYDIDSRQSEKIHRKCIKQYSKLSKIYDGDIYDLANELQGIAE